MSRTQRTESGPVVLIKGSVYEEDKMSEGAKVYVEEIANGVVPAKDSFEAKEYRAWKWAQEKIAEIKNRIVQMDGFEAEMAEEYMGEMYR